MQDNRYVIEQVKEFSSTLTDALRKLIAQLGNHAAPLTDDDVRDIVSSPGNWLFVAKDSMSGEVVGTISVILYRIPYVKKGMLEDLVVDKEHRGKGIATKLLHKAIETAREENVKYIDFTSSMSRESGNALYKTLGFQKRETNVYRVVITQ